MLLIKNGANIELANRDGVTALMYAILWDKIEIAKALISKGSNLKKKDIYGRDALTYAIVYGRTILAEYINNKLAI